MFSGSHLWLTSAPDPKYQPGNICGQNYVIWTSQLRDITGLCKVRLFTVIFLWTHFITQTVITHQTFYLCKYTHNSWVSLYLKVKSFRQQLISCQEDVVFHRQHSGGNQTSNNAEQLHCSDLLLVPTGMACCSGPGNTEVTVEKVPPL